ncbi:MAG: GNAT family N-acetyltransferase [Pseudomonadota bacterium]
MTNAKDLEISWLEIAEADAILPEWQTLVTRTNSDVWFSPDWIRPWSRHFAGKRQMRLLSARSEGTLVAVLPFVIDTLWPFGVPVRLAQLAGPHPLFGVLALPIEKAQLEEVIKKATHDLITSHRCNCVSLAPISDTHGNPEHIEHALASMSDVIVHPDTCPRAHTIIPLPDSFDDYLSKLSRNRRNKYRKTKRILEEDHNVTTQLLTGTGAAQALNAFIDMHNAQWQEKGRLGHFADWPGSAAFYADFCATDSENNSARLYLQRGPTGDAISALFCFVAGQSCHALVPARRADPSLPKLDIGLHAQFERIEHLIGENIRVLDSGAGEYDYKASLKGETVDMHRFLIGRKTPLGKAKLALLRHYANCLNLLYYRIWFNRMAPKLRKLGLKTGPLWQSWIRSRV